MYIRVRLEMGRCFNCDAEFCICTPYAGLELCLSCLDRYPEEQLSKKAKEINSSKNNKTQ